jgi:hypothetical protein
MANQKIVYNKFDIPIGRFLNTNMKIMLKSLIDDSLMPTLAVFQLYRGVLFKRRI